MRATYFTYWPTLLLATSCVAQLAKANVQCGAGTKLQGNIQDTVEIVDAGCSIADASLIYGDVIVQKTPAILQNFTVKGNFIIYFTDAFDVNEQFAQVQITNVIVTKDLLLPDGGSVDMQGGKIKGSVDAKGAQVHLNQKARVLGNFYLNPLPNPISNRRVVGQLYDVRVRGDVVNTGRVDDMSFWLTKIGGRAIIKSIIGYMWTCQVGGNVYIDAEDDINIFKPVFGGKMTFRSRSVLLQDFEKYDQVIRVGQSLNLPDWATFDFSISNCEMNKVMVLNKSYIDMYGSNVQRLTTKSKVKLTVGGDLLKVFSCVDQGQTKVERNLTEGERNCSP